MKRIGTRRDALRAVRGELNRVSSGSSRTTYVDDRGRYVYKVQHGFRETANRDEHMNATYLRVVVRRRDVPRTSLWQVMHGGVTYDVLCMPYFPVAVSRDGDADFDKWAEEAEQHIDDIHPTNVRRTPSGRMRCIDLQYVAYEVQLAVSALQEAFAA